MTDTNQTTRTLRGRVTSNKAAKTVTVLRRHRTDRRAFARVVLAHTRQPEATFRCREKFADQSGLK